MIFEFDGEKYKTASKHQKKMGRELISELRLRGDEAILDLGCGDGVLTEELARLVPKGRVLGLDGSRGMIEAARKLRRENLEFVQMDINEMSYSQEFDVVLSNAALHWIKNHRILLGNIYRSLKPGGIVRYNIAGAGNCTSLLIVLNEVMGESDFSKCFLGFEWPWYMPKLDDYMQVVAESDFSEKRVWGENTDGYFASVDEMVGWIDQPCLVPFLRHVDHADRQRFRSIVIERMIKRTLQEDGRCFETGRRINVFARK